MTEQNRNRAEQTNAVTRGEEKNKEVIRPIQRGKYVLPPFDFLWGALQAKAATTSQESNRATQASRDQSSSKETK